MTGDPLGDAMAEIEPSIQSTTIRCRGCGYDLSGTSVGGKCPECGMSVAETLRPVVHPGEQTHRGAVWCVVLGAISPVVCAPLGLVAVIIYLSIRRELQSGAYSSSSKTMATVGLCLGLLSTMLLLLGIAIQAFNL